MSTAPQLFAPDLISQFNPLNKVAQKYRYQLSDGLKIDTINAGKTITRISHNQTTDHSLLHFLVSGSVEIRESFNKRHRLSSEQQLTHSLESLLPNSGSIKAVEDCQLLIVDNILLDQLLALDQDYQVFYIDDNEFSLSDDTLIDDNFQEDWDDVFIRSHLARNLPHAIIQQIISELEDITVTAGELVVKARTPGDYFYLVKKGTAMVSTEANGPFKGVKFPLDSGQYFGDEALVAGTLRNADVVMDCDGLLGRLDIDAFNQLIRPYLIPTDQDLAADSQAIQVLDVRFAAEYQRGHIEGSKNIPICYLRQKMADLKNTQPYVITPANDRRAELATYIMRQAGYQAFHQASHPTTL